MARALALAVRQVLVIEAAHTIGTETSSRNLGGAGRRGLGIHLTPDLAGRVRFGLDIEWIDQPDYTLNDKRAQSSYEEIRRYWPGLGDGQFQPGYAGIQPKLSRRSEPAAGFVISGPADHGVPGLVNSVWCRKPWPDLKSSHRR